MAKAELSLLALGELTMTKPLLIWPRCQPQYSFALFATLVRREK